MILRPQQARMKKHQAMLSAVKKGDTVVLSSGVIGKVVEYPFDTVKVRLQCQEATGTRFRGAADCFVHLVRYGGAGSIYRGLSAPLAGSIAENAVLFAAYGSIQKLLRAGSDAPLTVGQLTVAGALAGTVVSFVMTPVELVKCRMQVQAPGASAGPWRTAFDLFKMSGVRSLFKGHTATMARETFGGAAWFGLYELTCTLLSPDGRKSSLSQSQLMAAGSLGGIANNAILFPADVVKSQVQVETRVGERPQYLRRLVALHRLEGVRGLYRGFGVTLLKAVPANAVIFGTYEYVSRTLSSADMHLLDTSLS